jgi:SAM-dependent methyltransferase
MCSVTHETLACPHCHTALTSESGGLRCATCQRTYPVDDCIADFSEGEYYDQFVSESELSASQIEGLRSEVAGARSRISNFYLGLLPPPPARILDCGVGNGVSIDILQRDGYEAWGVDSSRLRKWQWRERTHRSHLAVATGLRLPFHHRYFDAVMASGVIEHIGVVEARTPNYAVRPSSDRDTQRRDFLRELLRVVKPDGAIYIDCPNGRFPVDFWHGAKPGSARLHAPWEGFLPSVGDLRRLVQTLDSQLRVEVLSPYRRLTLQQVRRHWYGRALSRPAEMFLWLTHFKMLRFLASSVLNPFIVVRISGADRPGRHG